MLNGGLVGIQIIYRSNPHQIEAVWINVEFLLVKNAARLK